MNQESIKMFPNLSPQEERKEKRMKYVVFGICLVILFLMFFPAIDRVMERGRDAKRLADVKELSLILEREQLTMLGGLGGVELEGCIAADSKTTTCALQGIIERDFSIIEDPMGNGICGAPGVTGPCHYGISREDGSPGARTDDYQICFYLEIGDVSLGEGFNSIVTGGRLRTGCK